jgi:hypothetical protein
MHFRALFRQIFARCARATENSDPLIAIADDTMHEDRTAGAASSGLTMRQCDGLARFDRAQRKPRTRHLHQFKTTARIDLPW